MSSLNFQQLPLGLKPRDVYTFESFVQGDNSVAVGVVQQCAKGQGEQQVYLWTGSGEGKSHLLQAASNLAAKQHQTVCYLPADELVDKPVKALEDLEKVDFICLDDVDLLAQSEDWQEALFDFINRIRDAGNRLLMAASLPPEALEIHLRDLHSRLMWGPVFQLQPLNDVDKCEALRLRAKQRGLELPQGVADYLISHFPRDLFGLFERLDKLDKASMAMQRKLTIPFVKSVLINKHTV